MGYIFVDRENEGGGMEKMRQQMRRNMRGGGYRGGSNSGSGNYHDGYRQGYKHGWEDHEDEWMDDDEVMYRRRRDSRGRFM
jgi:hypothetical protein